MHNSAGVKIDFLNIGYSGLIGIRKVGENRENNRSAYMNGMLNMTLAIFIQPHEKNLHHPLGKMAGIFLRNSG
jgi:hypothetical protein